MKLLDRNRMEEKLVRLVTPRKMAVVFTIIYVLSLIPLLWIGWYNYPSADDYSIGRECHQIWMGSHSIFQTLWKGVVRAADDWLNWMGYFTSNFLMAVPPSTFGVRGYVLTVWIMLGMLTASTLYLFHSILVKAFHADKYITHTIAVIVLFVSVQCMCPAGRVEAFYWYSGAANYILVHGMSLFFLGLLLSAYYDKGKKRIWDLTAASVLGFLTGGGNQMTALNVAIVVLTAAFIIAYRKNWKRCRMLGVPMGLFYLGFILNIAAPGNWVRAADASGLNPVKAILVSFYECLDRVIGEWTTWPVILLMIMLVPLFWHLAGNIAFEYQYPVIVVLFGYCMVSAMMTPPLFAVGNMEAGRLQALTYLMYILVLSLCVGYVTGWCRRKTDASIQSAGRASGENSVVSDVRFSANACLCLIVCVLLWLFGSVLMIMPEPYYFTFSAAAEDLLNGNAAAYAQEIENRIEIYNDNQGKTVVVDELASRPGLLFFSDIKEDPEDWENRAVAKYYGIEAVIVDKRE